MLELHPIPGQPGLFRRRRGALGDIWELPGMASTRLINRRAVLRKNWMNLRSQLGRGTVPAAGIPGDLYDAAGQAFNAFIAWDDGIGTLKEIGGAYEAEVVDQESIYDMYSTKVARALQAAGQQPTFTTGIPRAQAPKPAPAPVSTQASTMPYPLPEPQPAKWDTMDYILASVAALSLVYILVDFRRPQPWRDEEVDIPEIRPPRGGRAREPEAEAFEPEAEPSRQAYATPRRGSSSQSELVFEP